METKTALIDENTATCEVPYEGNENYEAGFLTENWTRKPIQKHKVGFEVEVWVEGYRQFKDQWLHDTFNFDTLNEALDFCAKIGHASSKEQSELLDFNGTEETSGWYDLSVEYMLVFQYTAEGKFEWERHRGGN